MLVCFLCFFFVCLKTFHTKNKSMETPPIPSYTILLPYCQKSLRIWPWNWKSNMFSQLHLQLRWYMLSGCKRIEKPACEFYSFSRAFTELSAFKVQFVTFTEIQAIATITPKSSLILCTSILCFNVAIFYVLMYYVLSIYVLL